MSSKFLFVNAMIVIHRTFIMECNSNRSRYFDISIFRTHVSQVPYDLVDSLSGNEVNESLFGRRCI